jgi:hypothetical protein
MSVGPIPLHDKALRNGTTRNLSESSKTLKCHRAALCLENTSAGGVLAADVRAGGDGRELALAKVIARLIGLTPDEVFRRAERERRRKSRLHNAIIGVLAVLAVAATGSAFYAWQQLKTNEAFLNATLKTATEIVRIG